jgi:hypothetical protein
MLVLIGPRWMDIDDEHGTRLLDRDNDPVGWEIEKALERNLRIIVVLPDNTTLDTARIPQRIAELGNRHRLCYRYSHHDHDVRIIIECLLPADTR